MMLRIIDTPPIILLPFVINQFFRTSRDFFLALKKEDLKKKG